MKKKITTCLLILLLTAVLPGCDDLSRDQSAALPGNPQSSEADLSSVVTYGRPAQAKLVDAGPDASGPARTRLKKAKQFDAAFAQFVGTITTAETWQDAHRAAQALLEESSPVARPYREQMAANLMLKEWLVNGENTSQKQKATALYTDLLVKNQSPQAAVVSRSLERLQGYWSEARMAQAARTVAREARAVVKEAAAQRPEGFASAMPETFRNEQERHLYQTREALARLEAMSKGGR